jgi:molybdopterin-binding protein
LNARGELLTGTGLRVRVGDGLLLDVPYIGLRSGELFAVLGPNGAGKSTLMRVMAMLQKPDSGSVSLGSATGAEAADRLRRTSAFVFQRPHLWAGTVRENIELGLRLRRASPERRRALAEEAAAQLGVAHLLARSSRTLSGGEAQRTAVARALAVEPEILFLDEPTANLDIDVRGALLEDLDRVARAGSMTIVMATHERSEAFMLADQVAVLRDGRVVQSGPPAELFENPIDSFIAAVTGAELSFLATVREELDGVLRVESHGFEFTVVGRAPLGARVRVAYRPEDLFLALSELRASPRNRFRARVLQVQDAGSLLRVRLEGAGTWVAVITRGAWEELALDIGSEVWVHAKATALQAFPV